MNINLEIVKCNICDSKENKIIKKIIIESGKFAYVCRCINCGLQYLSPRPKDMSELYSSKYWELNEKTEYDFLNRQRAKKYAAIIYQIKKHFKNRKSISILDVGAGDGLFLKMCGDTFKKYGTELTKSGVSYLKSKGLTNIYLGDFTEIHFKEKYDIIILIHVIEHLKNPSEFLKHAKQYLDKEGILIILTPNENSIFLKLAQLPLVRKFTLEKDPYIKQRRIKNIEIVIQKQKNEIGRRRFLIHSLHHFYFFTPKTIKKVLNKNNFKLIKVYTGDIIKSKSLIKKVIANNFINMLAKFSNMQEELFIIAKLK